MLTRVEYHRLAELAAVPELADLGPDAVADALNAKTIDAMRPLTPHDLLTWLAIDSHLLLLEDGTQHAIREVANACRVALMIFQRPTVALDLTDRFIAARLAVITGAGILTEDHLGPLRALATTKISLAEQAFGIGVEVNNQHVYIARHDAVARGDEEPIPSRESGIAKAVEEPLVDGGKT